MARNPHRPVLSAREHLAHLRALYPQFVAWLDGRSGVVCEGDLTPTPLSETYRIRVAYRPTCPPDTRVLRPELRVRPPWRKIPHMYDQKSLCLYLPGAGEWTPDQPLTTTVIPWASEWLFFYELWHLTGSWHGGGVEPKQDSPYRRLPPNPSHGSRP